MKLRIAWVSCPDCGRNNGAGGCYIAQKKWLCFWSDFLTTHDRDGSTIPEHYPTERAVRAAIDHAVAKRKPSFRVIREIVL